MIEKKVDVVVVGSGPAGEGAAMHLAKNGKRVAVVERYDKIGGGCAHWGTIPSKALRFAIYQLTEALRLPLMRACGVTVDFGMADLTKRTRAIVEHHEGLRRTWYDRNQVELIDGHGRLAGAGKVVVDDRVGIACQAVVLAPGSRPYRPDAVAFDHPRIYDSDSILSLSHKPRSMIIYGAGVIGCEYASMLRFLDIKINLVNSRDRLLDFLDDEISDALGYHLRENGIVVRHNETMASVSANDDGVELVLESGKIIRGDAFLWAVGRTGNTDDLGLDSVGIVPDSRGYVKVNDAFETEVRGVYTVGDAVGFPSLASAAYTQGRIAAKHILGDTEGIERMGEIPSGIYTSPEISSFGKTERELTEARVPYEVGVAHFKHLAKAQITGQQTGMLKLLFHRETLAILGIHCFGANASEIVHIGQAVMENPAGGNTLKYFLGATFNYPTMAEAYRVAAFNGYNRL